MTDAVAWALVHFVWQGALLGLASWLLQRLVRSPQARYIAGVITLAAMPVVFAWTAARQMPVRVAAVTTVTEIGGRFESAHAYGAPIDAAVGTASSLPSEWIVVLWAFGIVVFTTRTAGGWMLARQLTRVDVTPVAPWVLDHAREIATSLRISRTVRVLLSARVPAPVLIGWIAPVILLPATALTGLSSAQVTAVLAHELAHVRRHDYLVNLLQTMVEAAFFFHPAVWLISRRVREDRELCCDDLALRLTDRMTYATALHTLAQRRPAALALGATGGSLVDRIRRITSVGAPSPTPKSAWIVLLPLIVVLSLAIPSASSESVLPPLPSTPRSIVPVPTQTSSPVPQTTLLGESSQERAEATLGMAPHVERQPSVPAALPVALDFFVPAVNAASLSEAPAAQQQAKAAEPVLHEVFVQGYVNRPGVRRVEASDSTVMRLIELSGGVNARAGDMVQIRNQDGQTRLELKLSDLASQDVAVQPAETVYVLSAPPKAGDIVIINPPSPPADVPQSVAAEQFVNVSGEVKKPGKVAWKEGMTVGDTIRDAGGLTPKGKLGKIRRLENKPDGSRVWVEIKGAKLTLETSLKPGDELQIARKFFGGN